MIKHTHTYISYIHTIFNLYQQYRHSMAVPSMTNAQGQVSVIQVYHSYLLMFQNLDSVILN